MSWIHAWHGFIANRTKVPPGPLDASSLVCEHGLAAYTPSESIHVPGMGRKRFMLINDDMYQHLAQYFGAKGIVAEKGLPEWMLEEQAAKRRGAHASSDDDDDDDDGDDNKKAGKGGVDRRRQRPKASGSARRFGSTLRPGGGITRGEAKLLNKQVVSVADSDDDSNGSGTVDIDVAGDDDDDDNSDNSDDGNSAAKSRELVDIVFDRRDDVNAVEQVTDPPLCAKCSATRYETERANANCFEDSFVFVHQLNGGMRALFEGKKTVFAIAFVCFSLFPFFVFSIIKQKQKQKTKNKNKKKNNR